MQPNTTIQILDDAIVNRIAAGEVVERPASIVKELVENAIDADATRIQIDLADGGISRIVITDDGIGMNASDLKLCLSRHATSKLKDPDLVNLNSFGFRGEALPSIASISQMQISSCARGSGEGYTVQLDAAGKPSLSPAPAQDGTRIEVEAIFHNTPARLKFMKSSRSEYQACVDMIQRLCLSHEEIAFTLHHNGRTVLQYPQQSRIDRIAAVMGQDFIDNSMQIDHDRDELSISGTASLPTFNRATSGQQYIFVNGRLVKDKLFHTAVRVGYQDVLAKDRFAYCCLFIDVPTHLVDINAHPAKTEVRFRDVSAVRALLIGALRKAIQANSSMASSANTDRAIAYFDSNQSRPIQQNSSISGYMPQSVSKPAVQANLSLHEPAHAMPVPPSEFTQPQSMPASQAEENQDDYPLGAALAQVHGTYVVAQTRDGMVIVDQHAAHERLVYETLKPALLGDNVATQPLLVPDIIQLSAVEAEAVLENIDGLAKLGLVIESFGQNAVLVREVPALLGTKNISNLIRDIAANLVDDGQSAKLEEKLHAICSSMACHGSIRAGKVMSKLEMDALLRQMETTPKSGQCNHGRPTYVKLDLLQIERLFGRK